MNATRSIASGVVVFAAAAAMAAPGASLSSQNGDLVAGSIGSAGEIDTFSVALPAGAVFSANAKSAKGGTPLRLRLLDPAAATVAEATGSKPKVAKALIAANGVHSLTVQAEDGSSAGGYSLAISWKSPKSASASVTVVAGGGAELPFAAEPGTKAAFVVKPARGSAAVAALVEVAGPDGFLQALPSGGSGTATLPALGAYALRFKDGGSAGGALTASVKLVPQNSAKRKLDLTSRNVPAGAVVVAAATIGKEGGVLVAPEGTLAGAGVALPPGAVKKPVVMLIGTAPDLELASDPTLQPAGPAVFVGPEGVAFPGAAPASLTLPYEPAFLASGVELKVLTRDAAGVVTEVASPSFRANQPLIDVGTSHFSSFQVHFRAKDATVIARTFHDPSIISELYGYSVAGTTDWVVTGSLRLKSAGGIFSGTVFVHSLSGGIVGPPVRIDPPSPTLGQGFGGDAAMQGDLLVVGQFRTRSENTDPGAVHVYRLIGGVWQFEQTLTGDVADANVEFGKRVAIDGARIAIGSPHWQIPGGAPTSAAYVFRHDGVSWVQEARVTSDEAEDLDSFGSSIALSGTTLAVGANAYPGGVGSVTVFARDAGTGLWTKRQRFRGDDSELNFGVSVALQGELLVIGANDANGTSEGRAAVYEGPPGAMTFVENLRGAGPLNGEFGSSCAIRGDVLIVGADALRHNYPGKVYAFERSGGSFRRTATVRGQDAGLPEGQQSLFGWRVAFAGARFVIGAPYAPGGPGSDVVLGGAAFVVELD